MKKAKILARVLRSIYFFGSILLFSPITRPSVTGLKEAGNVSLSTIWNLPLQLSGGGLGIHPHL
jgi:hypothetical protein